MTLNGGDFMLIRAFIARTYTLQNRLVVNGQLENNIVYLCSKDGDKSIEFTIENVLKNLEFDKLTDITCKNLDEKEKANYFSSLEHAKLYISIFFRNIKEFSDYYISKGVISEVLMFYPFIRISSVDNSVSISFFFYHEYTDGRKTFTIFERVPDVDNKDTTTAIQNDFLDTFDTEVRYSRFIAGDIFEYFPDHITENAKKSHTPVITFNYILAELIKQNFAIDITNLDKQTMIWTEGELLRKMNKSDYEQIFVDEDCIYIAYNSQTSEYTEHLNRVMNEFFTIIHFSATYNIFKKLIKRSDLSAHDIERLKRVSMSLDLLMRRLKIKISEGEQNILKNYLPNLMNNPKVKLAFEIIKFLLTITSKLS